MSNAAEFLSPSTLVAIPGCRVAGLLGVMYSSCIGNTRWQLYPNLHLNMNLSYFLLYEKNCATFTLLFIEIFFPYYVLNIFL